MVAPVIAGAARALAPKVASSGGKWMHSSNAGIRSMGSKMLGYGGKGGGDKLGTDIQKGFDKLTKSSNIGVKTLAKIASRVNKVLNFMAKHSPALKQQLVILGKGLSVMLRPIGDIMAKFLRPMSIWVMKVAQKWYKMFGTGSKEKESAGYIEDEIKQLETEKESALLSGDTEKAAAIETQIQEKKSQLSDKGGEGKSAFSKIWEDLIPAGLKEALIALGEAFKQIWDAVSELAKLFWTIFGPGLTRIANIIGLALVDALKLLTFLFLGIAKVFEALAFVIKLVRIGLETVIHWFKLARDWVGKKLVQAFKWLVDKVTSAWDNIKKFGSWIGDVFSVVWTNLKTGMSSVWEWITNTFIGIWEKLKTSMSNVWDTIKNLIDKLMFWKKDNGGDDSGHASGGFIPETGKYLLHAGERVLTAGDTARAKSGDSNIFNNIFNVNATINNDMDIRELAEKLSELNETELRRRVSYV